MAGDGGVGVRACWDSEVAQQIAELFENFFRSECNKIRISATPNTAIDRFSRTHTSKFLSFILSILDRRQIQVVMLRPHVNA